MKKLSANFAEDEFACKCCGEAVVEDALVNALQELRYMLRKPIRIISGYRCPKHNKAVKGSKNSQHMLGRAADIQVDGMYPYEVADAAEMIADFKRGGIGRYDTFTHVDVRGNFKMRRARWSQVK